MKGLNMFQCEWFPSIDLTSYIEKIQNNNKFSIIINSEKEQLFMHKNPETELSALTFITFWEGKWNDQNQSF